MATKGGFRLELGHADEAGELKLVKPGGAGVKMLQRNAISSQGAQKNCTEKKRRRNKRADMCRASKR